MVCKNRVQGQGCRFKRFLRQCIGKTLGCSYKTLKKKKKTNRTVATGTQPATGWRRKGTVVARPHGSKKLLWQHSWRPSCSKPKSSEHWCEWKIDKDGAGDYSKNCWGKTPAISGCVRPYVKKSTAVKNGRMCCQQPSGRKPKMIF